jgi:hypothetical protein
LINEYKKNAQWSKKCTKISLEFLSIDARDFIEKRYKGKVVRDGRAVQITIPTLASFWILYFKRLNKERMKEVTGNAQDKDVHETMVTRLKSAAENIRTMNIIYTLPEGMQVTNKLFNAGASDQFELVPKHEGIGSNFDGLSQSHFLVKFEMVVAGSIVMIRDVGSTAGLTARFAGMTYESDDTTDDDDNGNSNADDGDELDTD